MNRQPAPVLKDLVLLGGGHSHAIVLKLLGMDPVPGLRVTVVARDVHTPYSGMLPGLIAGHYTFDDAHIDLEPLAGFAGARLFHDEAAGLDLAGRAVLCRNRPPVPYDVLSINVGARPSLAVAGAPDHGVPVKPIGALVERWERLQARVLAASRPLQVAVVGAGAAGIELTLAMQHALRKLLAEAGRAGDLPAFHLFSATARILPTHNRRVGAKFMRVLRGRGIRVHAGARVCAVTPGAVRIEGGETCAVDEVIWATEAGAPAWPGAAGLAVDRNGFIAVADTLESTSHPGVFAAGDVAAVVDHPREKAGVFAVRQGRPLHANLRRAVRGEPLAPFRPQRAFLSLITTGDRYAVASRGPWSVEGRWVWKWKDWIDQRFMHRFSRLPDMPAEDAADPELARLAPPEQVRELAGAAMRCAGVRIEGGRDHPRPRAVEAGAVPAQRRGDGTGRTRRRRDRAGADGMLAVRTVDAFPALVDVRTCSGGSRRTTAWATSTPWGRSRARRWPSSPFRPVPRTRRKRCCGTCSPASSRRCARRKRRSSAGIPPRARS